LVTGEGIKGGEVEEGRGVAGRNNEKGRR